jgi:hypothetical protein
VRIAIEPAFLSAAKGGAAAFEPNSIQRGGSCLARQQNIAGRTITQNGSAAQKVAQERQWLKKTAATNAGRPACPVQTRSMPFRTFTKAGQRATLRIKVAW